MDVENNLSNTAENNLDSLANSEASSEAPEFSPSSYQEDNTSASLLTAEQVEEIISLLTKVSEHDYTEQIANVVSQNEIVVEHAQFQSDLLGYATGFLCFFVVVVLCTYVYKFFRLFF